MPQLRVGDAEVPDGLLLQQGEHSRDSIRRCPVMVQNSAWFGFGWGGLWWRWRRGRWEKISPWVMELDGSEMDPVLAKAEPVLGLFGLGW